VKHRDEEREFENRAKELLTLAYGICEDKTSESKVSPPPPLETLQAATLTLKDAILTFEAAARST
jgi:hypothetical protein